IDISFRHTTIHIKKGKIEATNSRSAFSATILPSNTSFIDDCITDLNSALGSYILNWFPGKIDDFKTAVVSSLKKLDINTVDGVNYPPGTTIIVDSPFDNPSKIIITASTLRKPNAGIRSEPGMICECIKQIFIKTSDKKISELYLPILGSGHGGLDIEIALICLVLSIKYFSARFHHIKDITILITENDCGKLSEKDKIVFWSLLRRGL
ncbi:MAG TPA: hypothetical protein DCZ43_09185, partial [candidate division Zixibacteria bacterium]|nr:hypothetical protein [candidate division Zixibacteria bacterium]